MDGFGPTFWTTVATLPVLAAVLAWVVRFRSRRADCEPHCRRCDYRLRGIESKRCPECGSRLYPRGIRYTGTWRPWSLKTRVQVWSVAASLAWCAATGPAILAPGLVDLAQMSVVTATVGAAWFAGGVVLAAGRPPSTPKAKRAS